MVEEIKENKLQPIKLRDDIHLGLENIDTFRSVAVGIWFPVGAASENENHLGISHFIEHLIFKGTRKYTSTRISEIFDTLGARTNAFTGKEYTCFYTHLISDYVERAFSLLSHLLTKPAFRKKDIKSEKNVVLQEIAMYEDSPHEQIHDYFARTIFNNSNLGNVILGSRESVSSLEKNDLKNFHFENYYLNKMVVTAAGNINKDFLTEMVSNNFKDKRYRLQKDIDYQTNTSDLDNRVFLHKKETSQAHLCIGFPIFGTGHPDRFKMAILDTILGGMMSSRLFKELREKRGLAYSIYSYHSYYRKTGYIASYIGTDPSKASDSLKLILEEFKKLCEVRVSEEELNKAKQHAKGRLALATESMQARMMRLGKQLLANEELLTIEQVMKKLSQVTSRDIQEVANKYLLGKPFLAAIAPLSEDKLINIIEDY